MKRKLNLLCSCVFFVVFIQVVKLGYEAAYATKTGLKIVMENKDKLPEINQVIQSEVAISNDDYHIVNLLPTKAIIFPDSILNTKTSEYIPIIYSKVSVKVGKSKSNLYEIIATIAGLLTIIAIITSLVMFLKLIIAINRSQIFCWKNVKRLRIMGFALFIVFLFPTIGAFTEHLIVRNSLILESYTIVPFFIENLPELFTVLGCFIIAEIFAIGLKMKEEQELTI